MKWQGVVLLGALIVVIPSVPAHAAGGDNGEGSPSPLPISQGNASVVLNTLEAGAGGTYTPMTARVVPPSAPDRPPITLAPGENPQGKPCPDINFYPTGGVVGPGTTSTVGVAELHPTFIRNASGGYDGVDTAYGYNVPDAIPAGGDPGFTSIGAPATAANIGGHIIAVAAILQHQGVWQDATPVPPYGGSCVGATFTYGIPFVAGNAPPPIPPLPVLSVPPFGLGSALMAEVTGKWRIGHVDTLPGPAANAVTYVHIPTCAWLDTGVPTSPVLMHAVKTTTENGLTLFLVYNLTITPGAVTWSWGDGSTSQSATVVGSPPASLPQYDPTTQTWTDPCDVSHAYTAVDPGRTVTASEPFSVAITVSWFDGVAGHTLPVPCDSATGGPCLLVIDPSHGWSSGPHPVEQIESVPYTP